MNCQKCKSDRILTITAKCSDLCNFSFKGVGNDGYVPGDCGVGGGDYVEIQVCLECGVIQGPWPLPDPKFYEEDKEGRD